MSYNVNEILERARRVLPEKEIDELYQIAMSIDRVRRGVGDHADTARAASAYDVAVTYYPKLAPLMKLWEKASVKTILFPFLKSFRNV